MTDTSRRTVLAASAGLGASIVTGPVAAQTAAPAADARQQPGFYRIKVGDAEITFLHDGFVGRRAQGLVRNAAQPEVEEQLPHPFVESGGDGESLNIAVVTIGARRYIIDSGFADNGPPTTGQLTANMRAAGIDPASINAVLVTHFHATTSMASARRTARSPIPMPRSIVPEAEWAFWMDDTRMARRPRGQRGNFALARRVFGPNAAMSAAFTPVARSSRASRPSPPPGHTPGHTSFV